MNNRQEIVFHYLLYINDEIFNGTHPTLVIYEFMMINLNQRNEMRLPLAVSQAYNELSIEEENELLTEYLDSSMKTF